MKYEASQSSSFVSNDPLESVVIAVVMFVGQAHIVAGVAPENDLR